MSRYNALFTVLPVAIFLAGCQEKTLSSVTASEAAPVEVQVIEVRSQPFTAAVAVTGTLVSRSRVVVKAETTGRIVRFPKEEGNRVEAGEAVVWVDDENYRLGVREAESAVQVAEAALGRAKVIEAHSQTELDRARNLVNSGGINDKDLKAAEVAAQEARAQIALSQAQLEQARAALAVTRKRLNDTVIQAPVHGEIQEKSANVGAYVEPPTPLFTLVDNARLELESPVASVDLAPVRTGQRVTFGVSGYPGRMFEGRVTQINPAVDPQTRSAIVRIQVGNSSGELKAGMFAEGEILTGIEAQAVVIPAAAVYRSDGSAKASHVFVMENLTARRRPVRIGRERDGKLEILGGLQPGDFLIAEQSIEIADGVRVQARK